MIKKDKSYDFQKFKTIWPFEQGIYYGELILEDVLEEQIKFGNETDIFKESRKPKNLDKKEKKALNFENTHRLLRGRQKLLNGFESGIISIKTRRKQNDII